MSPKKKYPSTSLAIYTLRSNSHSSWPAKYHPWYLLPTISMFAMLEFLLNGAQFTYMSCRKNNSLGARRPIYRYTYLFQTNNLLPDSVSSCTRTLVPSISFCSACSNYLLITVDKKLMKTIRLQDKFLVFGYKSRRNLISIGNLAENSFEFLLHFRYLT